MKSSDYQPVYGANAHMTVNYVGANVTVFMPYNDAPSAAAFNLMCKFIPLSKLPFTICGGESSRYPYGSHMLPNSKTASSILAKGSDPGCGGAGGNDASDNSGADGCIAIYDMTGRDLYVD